VKSSRARQTLSLPVNNVVRNLAWFEPDPEAVVQEEPMTLV
jgi:hypothetical protein